MTDDSELSCGVKTESVLLVECCISFLKSRCYALATNTNDIHTCIDIMNRMQIPHQMPKRMRLNSTLQVAKGLGIGAAQAMLLCALSFVTSVAGGVTTAVGIAHVVVMALYGAIVLGGILAYWEPYYMGDDWVEPIVLGSLLSFIPIAICGILVGVWHAVAAVAVIGIPAFWVIQRQLTNDSGMVSDR